MKIKKGQLWEPKLGGTPIEIVKATKPERFWMTRKTNGSPNSHSIHEKTLTKFYKLAGYDE